MLKFNDIPIKLYEFQSGKELHHYESRNFPPPQAQHTQIPLIFMRESEAIKKDAFFNFSNLHKPSCILDLRIAPRLDVFHGSRKLTFSLFENLDIEYYDFFGRIGIFSKDQISEIELIFAETFIYLTSRSSSCNRPIVLFYDSTEIISECFSMLKKLHNLNLLRDQSYSVLEYKSGLLTVSNLLSNSDLSSL